MEHFGKVLSELVGGAEKLGTLSVAAVYAFFNILMIAYIIWDLKAKKKSSEMAWDARSKDAEADIMIANAIEKLADQIKELRFKLKCAKAKND